jgi:amino acid transporter
LIFAMARDQSLPFARTLALVPRETRTPLVPALLTGLFAALILAINVNLPNIIEALCSVSIVWANLAYLMVSVPLLMVRRRGWPASGSASHRRDGVSCFTLGRWGFAVNLVAVCWGLFVVINMSWPRPEIYGTDFWGRHAAIVATAALLGLGGLYYLAVQRRRIGILAEHAVGPVEIPDPGGSPEWAAPLAGGD